MESQLGVIELTDRYQHVICRCCQAIELARTVSTCRLKKVVKFFCEFLIKRG
jgi:hypothetical protein